MNIECTIDFTYINENLNSQMPLSYLIRDLNYNDAEYIFYDCSCAKCGKCLVYIEGEGVCFSCLVPVLSINKKHIITQDAYMLRDIASDVQDAFKILKISPCSECYKSKVMLIGYIVERLLERDKIIDKDEDKTGNEIRYRENLIHSSIKMSTCKCMLESDIYSLIDTTLKIRRNHLA